MPSSVGHYVIERTLYKDALGMVYAAIDPKRGRNVTIKTIAKAQLDAWGFARAAQAAMQLKHPNILEVYGAGDEGDIAYLVMEYVKGRDLASRLEGGERFDLPSTGRIMSGVCEALACAHDANVVHGDVHPGNVIVDDQGGAKLTGFGIARSAPGADAPTTSTYPSPEQVVQTVVDHRTDIFSAGTVLYELLTGFKPFPGAGVWTVAKKIIQEEPVSPYSLNRALSYEIDGVVRKALAKKPDERYPSAREFGAALEDAIANAVGERPDEEEIVGLAAPPSATKPPLPVEVEFWRTISESRDPHDFQLYLEQFPDGLYAELAKRRIAKLRDR